MNLQMEKQATVKPGTPNLLPSKTIITSWLKSLFPDLLLNGRIQQFGDGVVYCRLLCHFYSNPPHSKITWSPKNQYQYSNNLKHVQAALTQLGIPISFDVNRVAKRKFLQNWALINAFYRHFNSSWEQPEESSHMMTNVNNNSKFSKISSNVNAAYSIETAQLHSRAPQGSLKRNDSSGSNQIDYRIPMKQMSQNIPVPYIPVNFKLQMWEQKGQAEIGGLARNSLQISQYLAQSSNIYSSSPAKGKWSVGSQMFQNNHNAVVDRVKQILLKGSHDTEKIRQIKMLLGMPLDQEQVIKIQDDGGTTAFIFKTIQSNQPDSKGEIVQVEPKTQVSQQQAEKSEQMCQKEDIGSRQQKDQIVKSAKKPFKV